MLTEDARRVRPNTEKAEPKLEKLLNEMDDPN
jgi:hypothetical protein